MGKLYKIITQSNHVNLLEKGLILAIKLTFFVLDRFRAN